MKILGKVTDGLNKVLKVIVSILCLCMLVLMFTEVVRRYMFGKTWVWSDELVRYMLVYISMLGGVVAYKSKAFVGFDLILNKLAPLPKAIMNIVINTIILALAAILAYSTYLRCIMPSTLRQVSQSLKIPMVYMYGVIGVAMLLIVIISIENYGVLIPALKKTIDEKNGKGGLDA